MYHVGHEQTHTSTLKRCQTYFSIEEGRELESPKRYNSQLDHRRDESQDRLQFIYPACMSVNSGESHLKFLRFEHFLKSFIMTRIIETRNYTSTCPTKHSTAKQTPEPTTCSNQPATAKQIDRPYR